MGNTNAGVLIEAVRAFSNGDVAVAKDYAHWITSIQSTPANPLYTLSRWFVSGLPKQPSFSTGPGRKWAGDAGDKIAWPAVDQKAVEIHLAWLGPSLSGSPTPSASSESGQRRLCPLQRPAQLKKKKKSALSAVNVQTMPNGEPGGPDQANQTKPVDKN